MNTGYHEHILRLKFGKYKISQGKNGIEYVVKCPYCNKKDKCYINFQKGTFICFCGCDAGNIAKLELSQEIRDFKPVEPAHITSARQQIISFPGEVVPLSQLPDSSPPIQYLKYQRKRAFCPKELDENFGVCYCVNGIKIQSFDTTNTLIFPIYMYKTLVGWQARLLYDPKQIPEHLYEQYGFIKDEDGDWVIPPRYMTSRGLSTERVLYNYDNARKSNVVVICEGPFDAISVGRCAVATFGKNVKETQTRLLKAYWDLAIVLLDPEDAEKESQIMYTNLSRSIPTVMVKLEGYKDPGDAPREVIWDQIYRTCVKQNIQLEQYKIVI